MLDTGSERNERQKMNEKRKSNTKQQILCLEIDMKCKVVELCIINRESGAKKRGKTHAIKTEWFRLAVIRYSLCILQCGPAGAPRGAGSRVGARGWGDGKRKKYSCRHCGTKFLKSFPLSLGVPGFLHFDTAVDS